MTPGTPAGNARWDDDPILTVEHLTMRFGGLVAVGDLSFNVGRGDITALIGPNGAGKTTVFNCVTGFYKPTEGRIVMRHGPGRQQEAVDAVTASGMRYKAANDGSIFLLERMPDFEISKRAKVARTFQNIRLFSGMTVLENLLVAQHNPLMVASGFTFGGILGLPNYRKAQGEAIDRARNGGSRSRGRCAPAPICCAWTNPPPASTRANPPSSTSCCSSSAAMGPRCC